MLDILDNISKFGAKWLQMFLNENQISHITFIISRPVCLRAVRNGIKACKLLLSICKRNYETVALFSRIGFALNVLHPLLSTSLWEIPFGKYSFELLRSVILFIQAASDIGGLLDVLDSQSLNDLLAAVIKLQERVDSVKHDLVEMVVAILENEEGFC